MRRGDGSGDLWSMNSKFVFSMMNEMARILVYRRRLVIVDLSLVRLCLALVAISVSSEPINERDHRMESRERVHSRGFEARYR